MTPRPVPDVLLERYLAGDLGADARARIDADLASSPELRARLAALQASRDAFLAADPPARFAHRVAVKAEVTTRRPGRRFFWLLAPAGAAAAGVLVVVVGLQRPDGAPTTRPEWREVHGVAPAPTPPVHPAAPAPEADKVAEAAPAAKADTEGRLDQARPKPAPTLGREALRRGPAPLPAADRLAGSGAGAGPKGGGAADVGAPPPSPSRAYEPEARPAAKKKQAEASDEVASAEKKVAAGELEAQPLPASPPEPAASASMPAGSAPVAASPAPPAPPVSRPDTSFRAASRSAAPAATAPPPAPGPAAPAGASRGEVRELGDVGLAEPVRAGAASGIAAGSAGREGGDGATVVSVQGPLTPAQVRAVVQANRARVRDLWALAGGVDSIRLVLEIDEKGRVTAARVTEPLDAKLDGRARALVRTWRFPAASGRTVVTLGLRSS